MAIENLKILPGNELLITIAAAQENENFAGLGSPGEALSGAIASKIDEPLKRRIQRTGTMFFDFGQIPGENGVYTDWLARVVNPPIIAGGDIDFYEIQPSDWFALNNEVIASADNLTTHSRQIEQIHNWFFNLSITFVYDDDTNSTIDLTTDERFASGALKLTADELGAKFITLSIYEHQQSVAVIVLKDRDNVFPVNKFTLLANFEADAVDFTVTNSDVFVIIPQFNQAQGRATRLIDGTGFNTHWLNKYYRIHPRALLFDETSDFYQLQTSAVVFISRGETPGEIDFERYERIHKIWELQKADADARAFYQFGQGLMIPPPTSGTIPVEEFPPDFASPPPLPVPVPPDDTYEFEAVYQAETPPIGFLLGIIVRGNQKIYCWRV